jgi:hypothetical protein
LLPLPGLGRAFETPIRRPRGIDASGREVFELVPLKDDDPTMRSDTEPLMIVGTIVEQRKRRRR